MLRRENKIKSVLRDNAQVLFPLLILLPLLIKTIGNPNNDFGTISAIVRDWVAGRTSLYSAESVYFAYTPWSLFVYLPLSFIPHPFGQIIFNFLSLCLLVWSTWFLSKPISWQKITISLTTIYTAMLIIQGQWDAIVLAALTLGWIGYKQKNPWLVGVAFVGMTTKYTYVVLPMIILLLAIRAWPIRKIIYIVIIPLLTLAISFIIIGYDWPIRYWRLLKVTMTYYRQYEMTTVFSTTIYPVSYRLMLPPIGLIMTILFTLLSLYLLYRLMRYKVNLESINLAQALNLFISPYFTFHHIIYLAPLHAQLLKKYQLWGFVLVGAAILDAMLLWLGVGLIIYPIIALGITVFITYKNLSALERIDTELDN